MIFFAPRSSNADCSCRLFSDILFIVNVSIFQWLNCTLPFFYKQEILFKFEQLAHRCFCFVLLLWHFVYSRSITASLVILVEMFRHNWSEERMSLPQTRLPLIVCLSVCVGKWIFLAEFVVRLSASTNCLKTTQLRSRTDTCVFIVSGHKRWACQKAKRSCLLYWWWSIRRRDRGEREMHAQTNEWIRDRLCSRNQFPRDSSDKIALSLDRSMRKVSWKTMRNESRTRAGYS